MYIRLADTDRHVRDAFDFQIYIKASTKLQNTLYPTACNRQHNLLCALQLNNESCLLLLRETRIKGTWQQASYKATFRRWTTLAGLLSFSSLCVHDRPITERWVNTHIMQSQRGCTSYAHRSKWSFWAKSCQSLPLALAVSKVAQILWRMDRGILKALGPVWDVMVQSVCIKNGTDSFSVWSNRTETDYNHTGFRKDFAFHFGIRTIQTGWFNILKHHRL